MYSSIEQFAADWAVEGAFTQKVLDALTDESLKQTVSAAQARTLGDLAWHLVGSIGAMLGSAGLRIDGPEYMTPTPASASDIASSYRAMSEAAVKALKEQWTDEKLPDKVLLFGFIETTFGGVLNTVVRHQIHHRGQMTILMRQAGVVPPGIYGPNEEETAAMHAAKG